MLQSAIAPFQQHGLPGAGGGAVKCTFAGDVSPQGASPSLAELAATCFHRMAADLANVAGSLVAKVPLCLKCLM